MINRYNGSLNSMQFNDFAQMVESFINECFLLFFAQLICRIILERTDCFEGSNTSFLVINLVINATPLGVISSNRNKRRYSIPSRSADHRP